MKKEFTTFDLSTAAYLKTNNIEITIKDQNGRKIFAADADENLYRLLNDYNSNALIGITDYVMTLKALKQALYAAKSKEV